MFSRFAYIRDVPPLNLLCGAYFHLLKECRSARSSSPLHTGLGLNIPPNRTLQVISKGSLLNLCYFLLGADLIMPYGALKNVLLCYLRTKIFSIALFSLGTVSPT